MNADLERQLARLQNRPTRHEVVLVNDTTGQRLLFCYCRKTRRGLVDYIRDGQNGPDLSAFTGQLTFQPTRQGDLLTIGAWGLRWSGRTERAALVEGELTFWKQAGGAGGKV